MSKYFDTKDLTFMSPQINENGRHMVMTNVHQEEKTKFVNIDTRFQDDYNYNNHADLTCTLPQRIQNVKSMKVTNIEIPATFYHFSQNRKNTYFLIKNETKPNDVNIPIRIPDGNYTSSTLFGAIHDVMTSSENGVLDLDISFSEVDICGNNANRVEMYHHNDSGDNSTYTIQFDVDEKGNSDKYNFKSKLGWALGFRDREYELTPNGYHEADAMVDIHPFRYIYLVVDEFANQNPNSFIAPSFSSYMNPNILARVSLDPNTYSFGDIIVANINGGKLLTDIRTYSGKTDIQRLHIKLIDEWGNTVDLNKMDFSFSLEIRYE